MIQFYNINFEKPKIVSNHNPSFNFIRATFCLKNFNFLDWINYSNKIFINISVFWDLYCAAPERRDSFEPTQEAKMFHDFVSKFFNLCEFVYH